MAGAAKAVGAILAILGVVALVGGLATAAYGLYDYDKTRHQLIRDSDREEADQAMVAGGAAVASGGLILFLAGLITLLASRPKPVPSAMPAPDAPKPPASKGERVTKATATSPVPRTPVQTETDRRRAVIAGTIAVVLVALVLGAFLYVQSGPGAGGFFGGGPEPEPKVVQTERFNGTVQGGTIDPRVPPLNLGQSSGDFSIRAGAVICTLTLDWSVAEPGGADELSLKVTANGSQVSEAEDPPGFSVQLPQNPPAGDYHFEVRPVGSDVVHQPFTLSLVCTA